MKLARAFLLQENKYKLSELNYFKTKENKNIFHILKKVSRLPFWIGHCHFCEVGHISLRLQSLKED